MRHGVVLVVEDDTDLRRMFRFALSLAGYDVREAVDGIDALQQLNSGLVPEVIVLDLGLPRLSGYAVRDELAARPATRSLPIVVITAEPRWDQLGDVTCVLRKPVDPERLLQVIRDCRSRPANRT
jgi:CheY-like chemotaxis protein